MFLGAGESKTVELNVSVADMALWNEKNEFEVETGEFIIWVRLLLSPACLADLEAEEKLSHTRREEERRTTFLSMLVYGSSSRGDAGLARSGLFRAKGGG